MASRYPALPTYEHPLSPGQRCIITEWVEALESGTVLQALDYLKVVGQEGAHYCCLGVPL